MGTHQPMKPLISPSIDQLLLDKLSSRCGGVEIYLDSDKKE